MSKPVTLIVSYTTPGGKRCEQSVAFDPNVAFSWQGFHQKTVHDMGRYIKSISETMNKVVESVNRVETSIDYVNYLLPRQHERLGCAEIALQAFERTWKDFKCVEFSQLGLYQLRIQCHATYEALCGVIQCSEALDEIRQTLLKMFRHDYRYTDAKVGDPEFARLGNSLVGSIAGIIHKSADVPVSVSKSESGEEATESDSI